MESLFIFVLAVASIVFLENVIKTICPHIIALCYDIFSFCGIFADI